jgi:hypothetical protein
MKDGSSQTFTRVLRNNFLIVHPNFLFSGVNSLFMICKNKFFQQNIKWPKKWSLFRELYGPSKFAEKFAIIPSFIPIHGKIYSKGISFRSGHIIIPNMNLEALISEIWANITVQILTENAHTTWDRKILINEEILINSFKFKIMLSHHIFHNGNKNFETLSQLSNDILRQTVSEKVFAKFLIEFGPKLSVLNNFAINLGLTSCFLHLQSEEFSPMKIYKLKISDFYKPEKNELFVELINMSAIGVTQLGKLQN